MTSESPRPNWNGIVAPIIEVKLGEARVAQAKTDERAKLQKEQRGQELLRTQQYQASLAEAVAKRWGLLDSLHAHELLEGLNTSQNVWRGLGTIESHQYIQKPLEELTSVEFSLKMFYAKMGDILVDSSSGTMDSWGTKSVESGAVGGFTYTKIGIFPANLNGEEERLGGQGIYLEGAFRLLRGSKFFNGNVLYVIDSDACLEPIEGADRFNEGDTRLSHRKNLSAIEAHDERMAKLYGRSTDSIEHLDDNGVFLLEAEHPQASEILVEVLKRSCINRAKGNLLPFQLKERGEQILREAGVKPEPVQKPKGFWGRLFG